MPWTFLHLITYIPTLVVLITVAYLLRKSLINKPEKTRMIPFKIISLILVISEILKQILSFINGYSLYHLPIHVCSLFIFVIPLMAFYQGKYVNIVRSITITLCMALTFMMFIMPNVIYSDMDINNFFNDYFSFHTVLFHNLVIFEFILILFLDLYSKKNFTKYNNIIIFGCLYCFIASLLSVSLKVNYSNFYSCSIPFLDNIRQEMITHLSRGIGQAIYSSIVFIIHIAFFNLSYYLSNILINKKEKLTRE